MSAQRNGAVIALRHAADTFETEMARLWGGERGWYTTGTHVAELAAAVLREMADDIESAPPPADDPSP